MPRPYPAARSQFAPARQARAAQPALLEALDRRDLMSVSQDAAGFTVVTPSSDSKVIYVSSTGGSDANSGLSAATPVKTIAKAVGLVRDKMPDQILLKRGDSWQGNIGFWKKSGRSPTEPMVLGAYGSGERPTIRSGTSDGMVIGSVAAKRVDNLVVQGLRFWATGRDPAAGGTISSAVPVGIGVISATHNLLIEDCRIEKYQANINFVPVYGRSVDATIRRDVLVNSYATNMGAHGIFATGVDGLTLEENFLDHNGWVDNEPRAKQNPNSHNAYITGDTTGVVARGNVFADAGSHGLQARSGGVVEDNLFVNNPIGMSYGIVNGEGPMAHGVSGRVQGNVYLGGRSINGMDRGIAMEIGNTKVGGGTVVRDNIISSYAAGKFWAIQIGYGVGTHQSTAVGVNDLTIENNSVYKWYKGVYVMNGLLPSETGYKHLGTVTLRNNTFADIASTLYINAANIKIDSTAKTTRSSLMGGGGWVDPDRDLTTYMSSLTGKRTSYDFLQQARTRAATVWDPNLSAVNVVNYVRAGFGKAPVSLDGPVASLGNGLAIVPPKKG